VLEQFNKIFMQAKQLFLHVAQLLSYKLDGKGAARVALKQSYKSNHSMKPWLLLEKEANKPDKSREVLS